MVAVDRGVDARTVHAPVLGNAGQRAVAVDVGAGGFLEQLGHVGGDNQGLGHVDGAGGVGGGHHQFLHLSGLGRQGRQRGEKAQVQGISRHVLLPVCGTKTGAF